MLELDPRRKDANLILGMYRYLVSILPRAFRMVAYLVGFDGGKEEALQLIEAAAAYPGETQAEAKIALVVLYKPGVGIRSGSAGGERPQAPLPAQSVVVARIGRNMAEG